MVFEPWPTSSLHPSTVLKKLPLGGYRGWFRWFCPPPFWYWVQGAHCSTLLCSWHSVFASRLFRNSSRVFNWVFCLFVSCGPEFPQLCMDTVVLIPINFFVFCSLRRGVCPGVNFAESWAATQERVPGLRPVSTNIIEAFPVPSLYINMSSL